MSNNFLVTGMFRSGTTMFARMLHANPNIACASDPFAPIYKSFRNRVAQTMFDEFDESSPLNDYYFDKNQNKLFRAIQNSDFTLSISSQEVLKLRHRIKKHCKPYSPKIITYLDELQGRTYEQLFDSGIKIVKKTYGKSDNSIIGFKEVWVNEFSSHFIKLNSGNKVIHVIRDPRSVVASNFASGERYPLLFLIRQWRKLAEMSLLKNDNSLIVKFEDLLQNPEKITKNICNFLGVEHHTDMVDPSTYKDGKGEVWIQNTSYKQESYKESQKFNKKALDKWKTILHDDAIELIEACCFFEMNVLGYKPILIDDINANKTAMLLDYGDDMKQCADWIMPYANYDNFKEIMLELQRLYLMADNDFEMLKNKNLLTLGAGWNY